MSPDQAAPLGHSVCYTGYLRTSAEERADDKSRDWRGNS